MGTYYLKITANQDLSLNPGPSISIDAEGVNNDVANGVTTQVTNRVYYFTRTIVPDPAAIGAVPELITISGKTPLNTDTRAAYTTTTVLTPAAPILTAAGNQVTVSWTTLAGVTAYQVWFGTSSDSSAAVQYGSDLTATTCTISCLSSGNTYCFWLKAKNQSGVSGFSAPATVTLATGIPGTPLLTSGANQLTASWTAVAGATAYEVYYGTFSDSSLAAQYGGDILGTTCTITGLTDGTAYFVWLKADNSGGSSGLSAPATVMLPPDAPGAPTLTPAANQLTVTWMAVAGATAYDVWYGTTSNSSSGGSIRQ